MNTKYIFVTGGVVSGLGKGITAASLGRLLKNRGYKVTNMKMDPYINYDSGMIDPLEHGESFITIDGVETDLDLGHYERFTDENLNALSSTTTGKIYMNVIQSERRGDYLGKTIQAVPHITDAIKNRIKTAGEMYADIVIVELGGTVGDIEGLVFAEAIRQMEMENPNDSLHIHVTLLPFISGSNELKTKPTQHSVKELQSLGIRPDILVCRCDTHIDDSLKKKIALFCSVKPECIIENKTVGNLYEVPLMLEDEGLASRVCEILNLNDNPDNSEWEELVSKIKISESQRLVKIAIVGQSCSLPDAYLSVIEAIKHAGYHNNVSTSINCIYTNNLNEKNVEIILSGYDAIVAPGGFGNKSIDGIMTAIKFARENDIPFLGISLGMHLAVIEFMRNVLGIKCDSEEFNQDSENPVIVLRESETPLRLGGYKCTLVPGSESHIAYNKEEIVERYKNKYEFNKEYQDTIMDNGLVVSGIGDDDTVEIVEIPTKTFFVACQFHPEFSSRPNKPAPLFNRLIEIAKDIHTNKD